MRGCNNSWVLHLTDLPNPRIQSANRRQVQLVPLAKRRQAIVQSLRPGRPRENRASEADVRSVPHHHQRSVPRSQHRRTNRAVGQNATCDPLNGLRCYNSEQTTKMCHDYEIRVLCWSAECTGSKPTLIPHQTDIPSLPDHKPPENQTCTDGEGWDNCAYLCDELCDYTARSSFGCDDSVSRTCVPGCKSLESLLCQPGEKRLNSTTCVPQEMCPCLKPDGTRAMPFETWKNPADSCSDCSCHSNAALCTVHDLTCTGVTPSATPTAQPGVSPNVQPACGWSAWMNVDKPSTGGGDVESLTLLRSVYSICDKPLMAQCRDAATQHPAPASVVCDVQEGLICTNADHAGLCSDYEIRVYCPCPVSTTPPTATSQGVSFNCVSGWSAWFNNDSPDTGDGDVEKMTSQQLSQFCAGGRVSQVDCRTTEGIEYFSSGEIVTCTVDTGLVCNNADNDPIPCSDYEIRYECSCPEPTRQTGGVPSAVPTNQAHSQPTPATTVTTVKPVGNCVSGWSAWFNNDSPNTGDGDVEKMTSQQLSQFCAGGRVSQVDCRTTGGIEYFSSGEIVTCTVDTGLVCNNADNDPIPCSDYEIRYECSCPEPTSHTGGVPSAAPTSQAHSQPTPASTVTTVKPVGNCLSGWSAWFNNDRPDTGDGDVEKMTSQQLNQFCAGGRVSQVDCRTTEGIEYFSSGEIVTCTVDTGLVCNNADNDPIPCSDYEIRYECSCPEPTRQTSGVPSAVPTSQAHSQPTPAATATTVKPIGNCVSGWSAWFNNDSPDTGDGDVEKMTSQQLNQFCAGGRVSQVDCRTTGGIEYFSSGEIVTCTVTPAWCVTTPTTTPSQPTSQTGGVPSAVPTNQSHSQPTPAATVTTAKPVGNCVSGWSAWFNNDSPNTGDGDVEKMTSQQLNQFCAGGRVSQVDCRTTEGIEYFSSGEIVTCTVDTGLVCNNADNDPIPCSDYEIRYECSCPEPTRATSGVPSAVPTSQAHSQPTPAATATTVEPVGNCVSGWSAWFNNDSPDTGDGDVEKMTSQQLNQFCAGGRVSQVDCRTTEGIEYFSSGEIVTCTLDTGLVCNNADNDPIPCSDYEIRYECSCPAPTTPAPTKETQGVPTPGPLATTAAPTGNCVSGWSAWFNNDSPDTGDGDVEKMTPQQLSQFCAGGRVSQVDCRTTEGIEYFSSGEIVTCTVDTGLVCNNADNDPIPCSDYEIRYECSCPALTTPSPTKETQGIPTTPGPLATTAAPTGNCISGWSAWFNNDSPDTGDGDVEKITPQQLSQFCAGGRVSQVDCRTTEGIEYFSSGEMLTCTVDGGLVCNNADNDPVPCSDYKIRYECSCPGASPAPEHTQRPSTAAVAITTAAAPRTCVNGWSAWINNDSPDTGDGDVEKMTSQQLSQFCPGGRVTQVDCRTTEDIEYFSSGEMLTCTVDGGLVCNNADNDPIPCSDYKIRYECSCHPNPINDEEPTITPELELSLCGWTDWMSGNKPSARGEEETITLLRKFFQFCRTEDITAVECRAVGSGLADSAVAATASSVCDTRYNGYVCRNDDLPPGHTCTDYEVRFLCEPRHMDCSQLIPSVVPPTRAAITVSPPSDVAGECVVDMGMTNGNIRDDMISASSFRDVTHAPQKARLNSLSSWMPSRDDLDQFIQVDLLAPHFVTGVTTQGRFDAPSYVTSYKVTFSTDGVNWNVYREEENVDKVLQGNSDSVTPVRNMFHQPIRARYVRIHPVTWQGRITLRFELQGCFEAYPTGVIPTAAPTAQPRATPLPKEIDDCVEWDVWVDLEQPSLLSRNDVSTLQQLQAASLTCRDPVAIQCRTATPDKTDSDLTGQHVRCNLWDGLVCRPANVSEATCFNYEARLGCLRRTSKCLANTPTAVPTAQALRSPGAQRGTLLQRSGHDLLPNFLSRGSLL
ncbi:mucin-5AC-like [Pomacea canaliculata]|uniref:mucin-5AC-like n=1 Tax=Pomacea canaliculata TaxID=400727 RepID=UPI000D733AA9|nr:mucin-5AC-like [Pomacea canaliculata]